MSRILLDTSAYSAYTGGHPDLEEPVRRASAVHLSVVVVGELLAAFLKGGRRRHNETRLREFAAEPRVRVLQVDDETAIRYAAIRDYLRRQGTPSRSTTCGSPPRLPSTASDCPPSMPTSSRSPR